MDISIVVPCYNEEESCGIFLDRIVPILESSGKTFEILFVNDGSRDKTLQVLEERQKIERRIKIIDLSRNFGKEAALTCGLENARGDAVIPIDVDLQDPPELIPQMISLWEEGFEVVLAQRADRSSDHPLKRKTAQWFYKAHNALSDIKIPQNVGDFRLMDKKVIEALKTLPESRRFMKGLFAWVGFRQTSISYTRPPREAGEGKFSGWKLWNFAIEGITSFSILPLQIWSYIGFVIAFLSFGYGSFIILKVILFGKDVPGYASLLTTVLFLGGIQLIGFGIFGEYLGRVYAETKRRPVYVIRETKEADEKLI